MNSTELKVEMLRNNDTADALAEALGIVRATLYNKMNQTKGADFTLREMRIIKDRYHLTMERLLEIFFTEEVSE